MIEPAADRNTDPERAASRVFVVYGIIGEHHQALSPLSYSVCGWSRDKQFYAGTSSHRAFNNNIVSDDKC